MKGRLLIIILASVLASCSRPSSYEPFVMKEQAEPILRQVPSSVPEYAEASRLLRFLRYFKPISDSTIPSTSLIREFLGGSSFRD